MLPPRRPAGRRRSQGSLADRIPHLRIPKAVLLVALVLVSSRLTAETATLVLAGGRVWYPASPVLGIYAAVTRQTLDGQPAGGWHPEERVDLETALRAYTVNNAWAAGEEDRKGSLAPGKLADVVVLDRDPFAVPPAQLKDLKVMMTVVGGRVVYETSPLPLS